MSDDTDRIKERIRKLLHLAGDDAAMGNEIDNALRFARRLMLEHNLSEADLEGTEPKDPHGTAAGAEATEYDRVEFPSAGSRLSAWECDLVRAVCALVGTIGWYIGGRTLRRSALGVVEFDERTGRPKAARNFALYGPAEDVRDALDLVGEWSLIIAGLGRLKYGGAFRGEGRAYCEGFAGALLANVHRVTAEERQASGGASSAMVVANANALMQAKHDHAEDYLRDVLGIRLCRLGAVGGGSWHPAAAGQGALDGSRASLSRTRAARLGGGG